MATPNPRRKKLASFLDSEVQKVLAIMNKLEQAGQGVIIDGVKVEITETKRKQMLDQIKKAAVVTDTNVKTWLVPAISEAYVDELNNIDQSVKKFGIKTDLGKITIEVLKTAPAMQPHLAAVNAIMSNAYLDFGSGITGWVKGNEHVINDVVKKQIQAKIATGRLTGDAVIDIKKQVIETLKNQGLQSLMDKGGREWTLDRYSEMLTRTHLIRSNTEASVNRTQELGIDIVEVSDHETEDSICQQYEGKIYSLSGNSKNYPKLPEFPPFHPNCKHTLLPRPDLE